MKTASFIPLALLLSIATVDAGPRVGHARAGAVGPRGAVEAEGTRVGRFGTGSVEAEGRFGGSVEASGTRVGRFSTGSVEATGPRGNSVERSATSFNGYRAGYVYRDGAYTRATVTVNSLYVAPIGVYAGWSVMARPYYISYPAYATYPVEVSVQVELQKRGYYNGPIDGNIGPGTSASISKYQAANGLPVTGTITQGLLKSLDIS